jgi:trans-2,3-dihydro-3-hydroxyanthranilate isomerase
MGRRSEIQARIVLKNGELSTVRIGGSAVPISSGKIKIP